MSGNTNLVSAKISRDDEYYTRLVDIERELAHYPDVFAGKSVYLPCDHPERSQFWRYFIDNADDLGWKILTATCLVRGGRGIVAYASRENDQIEIKIEDLSGDGDFLSDECLDILDVNDIVVTNLPFSIFRVYVKTMMDHGGDFIVIGGKNGGKYQDTVGYIVDGRMRLGANEGHGSMLFTTEDGETANVGSYWYTTLHPQVKRRPIESEHLYAGHEELYPKYANYDAIEVSKMSMLPIDYTGKMGVPITFLEYYDEDEWILYGTNATVLENAPQDPNIKANSHLYRRHNLYIEQEGQEYKYRRIYDRLIIQRKS